MQYIFELNHVHYILPSIQMNIQILTSKMFKTWSSLDISKNIPGSLNNNNINSNNTKLNDNIGVQSSRTINRKHRCLLYAKTQIFFAKNRSRLTSALFDGDDITQYFTDISNANAILILEWLVNILVHLTSHLIIIILIIMLLLYNPSQ